MVWILPSTGELLAATTGPKLPKALGSECEVLQRVYRLGYRCGSAESFGATT